MVNIKVKFRPSTVEGKPGTIYYQLSNGHESRQVSSRVHVFPEEWERLLTRDVSAGFENDRTLCRIRRRIDDDVARMKRTALELDINNVPYTIEEIITNRYDRKQVDYVFRFMEEQIERLRENGKFGTAQNYMRTMRSFSDFLQGRDLLFWQMDTNLVASYSAWLVDRGVLRNSISFYMRNLRAIFNKAVEQNHLGLYNPFKGVYTGIDRTRKRAVGEQVIANLGMLDLSHSPSLAFARDLFIFSYCARGMAFVDVAFLKKTDIREGFISYLRHKTGQLLYIHIESCMWQIIDRYAKAADGSPYVFPVLRSTGKAAAYAEYLQALNYYNKRLRILSGKLGGGVNLSSYTARHSWACAARKHNIPLSVISAGMGHASEKTTQIYLASIENAVIDRANKHILKALQEMTVFR